MRRQLRAPWGPTPIDKKRGGHLIRRKESLICVAVTFGQDDRLIAGPGLGASACPMPLKRLISAQQLFSLSPGTRACTPVFDVLCGGEVKHGLNAMLRKEQNDLLTQTGPGTPMGQ